MKGIQTEQNNPNTSRAKFIKLTSDALFAATMIAFVVSTQALAQERPQRGKPPQEAFDACTDKAEGDSVSFETRRGDAVEGTCRLIHDQLVAVPLDHKDNNNE
jgi:hypothetical protein